MTAKILHEKGHEVFLHAKNQRRAEETAMHFQNKVKVFIADLSDFEEVKKLAREVNSYGVFDVIIHNAGVFHSAHDVIFKVNTLAPYMLTALMHKPKRMIYIGSNMHSSGTEKTENLSLETGVNYSTSKLQVLMLGLAIAKKWSDVCVCIVDPGWVRTKMANYSAPDTLEEGTATQAWLALSAELATHSGKCFHHLKEVSYSSKADNINAQEKLLQTYEKFTNVYL